MTELSRGGVQRYRFDPFEVDVAARELRRAGRRVPLQDRPFQLLVILLEQPGREVSREELQRRLWPGGTFVDFETGLNTAVKRLRDALGDSAQRPRFIETRARHGYRLIAAVEAVPAEPSAPSPPPPGTPGAPNPPEPEAAKVDARRTLSWRLAVALLLLLASGFAWLRLRPVDAAPKIHSLAVLPFDNLSGDPAQQYFAEGMNEELTSELSRLSGLRVLSRTSAGRLRQSGKALSTLAGELGVDAVIEGSVARLDGRMRVSVALVDAGHDRTLWSSSYDRQTADAIMLQEEIARTIADEIALRLTPEDVRRLHNARSINPEAHDAYLKGRFFWNKRTDEGLRASEREFSRAVELDPQYSLAYAGLADTLGLMAISGYDLMPATEVMPRAKAAALRALGLDPQLGEAHATLAWIAFTYEWDFPRAEAEFRTAIRLSPEYATAHQWFADFLCAMSRLPEATAEFDSALRLDPLSLIINTESAWPLYYGGRHEEAILRYRRTLALDDRFAPAHLELGMEYAALGRLEEALAEYRLFERLGGDPVSAAAYAGNVLARAGHREDARRELARIEKAAATGYVPPFQRAIVYVGLGDHGRALEALQRTLAERSDFLLYLRHEPLFEPLRSDPRFTALLARIGLP